MENLTWPDSVGASPCPLPASGSRPVGVEPAGAAIVSWAMLRLPIGGANFDTEMTGDVDERATAAIGEQGGELSWFVVHKEGSKRRGERPGN